MDELTKIRNDLNESPSVENSVEIEVVLDDILLRLDRFIEKTAYVVPKCPKCGSDKIRVEHDPECWFVNCDGCDEADAQASTPAEAAAAFGETSNTS